MNLPQSSAPFACTLGVIAQVPHWVDDDGASWAYEPYVREMRLWAKLFARVRVCAVTGLGPKRHSLAPYNCTNLRVTTVPYSLDAGWLGIRQRLEQFPGMVQAVWRTIRETDFLLLRSPNHLSLVGAVLARIRRQASITKWAGENGAYRGEKFVIRLNRLIESLPHQRHPVLVYGPPKRPHQIEFLPALMSEEELQQARDLAEQRVWMAPWQIVSVGRLEPVKGFHLALQGLSLLAQRAPQLPWHYTLIGDGSARHDLESLAKHCGIGHRTTFTGALPFGVVQQHYAKAHLIIMPGTMEGWPKVIAEAWAHGAFPVAALGGLVPWILRDKQAGHIFQPNPEALATTLNQLLLDPVRLREMSVSLYSHAVALSLEQFVSRLEQSLASHCGLQQTAYRTGDACRAL